MQLDTKHFGLMEIDEKGIIYFPEGLPGFENIRKFTLLSNDDKESPFKWLQSVDEPGLAFVVADPFLIKKDYDIEIKDEILTALGVEKPEDILVYSIVVVPEDISKISINLKAPVVINTGNHKGMQVILDTDRYGVRHYILEELHGQEVTGNACSDKEKGTVGCNK